MAAAVQLILCDLRDDIVRELEARFSGVAGVLVKRQDITKVKCNLFGTAGNSFGDMGGGVDKALDDFSGGSYQRKVQERIGAEWFGELPVGAAVHVPSEGKRPGLIYAPTMRIPGKIRGSINAYLAMRAILGMQLRLSIPTIACPALGTGVGGLTAADAADQLYQAYRLVAQGEWRSIKYSLQAPYVMR